MNSDTEQSQLNTNCLIKNHTRLPKDCNGYIWCKQLFEITFWRVHFNRLQINHKTLRRSQKLEPTLAILHRMIFLTFQCRIVGTHTLRTFRFPSKLTTSTLVLLTQSVSSGGFSWEMEFTLTIVPTRIWYGFGKIKYFMLVNYVKHHKTSE